MASARVVLSTRDIYRWIELNWIDPSTFRIWLLNGWLYAVRPAGNLGISRPWRSLRNSFTLEPPKNYIKSLKSKVVIWEWIKQSQNAPISPWGLPRSKGFAWIQFSPRSCLVTGSCASACACTDGGVRDSKLLESWFMSQAWFPRWTLTSCYLLGWCGSHSKSSTNFICPQKTKLLGWQPSH